MFNTLSGNPPTNMIQKTAGDVTNFGGTGFDLNAMMDKATKLRDTGAQMIANPSSAIQAVGSTYCLTAHPELYYGVGGGGFVAGLLAYFLVSRITRAFKPKVVS